MSITSMEDLTISRALTELNLLDKRINKGLTSTLFITVKNKNSTVNSEQFSKDANSSFHSISDLINRRNVIKQRITLSNATTTIKIGDKSYTVAEAIDRKNSIQYEKNLLNVLRQQRQTANSEYERLCQENQRRINDMIQREIGKDQKTNVDLVLNLEKSLTESNKAEILDPLSLDKVITNLEQDIEEFESEVDFKLSESNALTTIKVPQNNTSLFHISLSSLKNANPRGRARWSDMNN